MERIAVRELIEWKESEERKPLIIYGTRQVGKTWLVREFAKAHFKGLVELDFNKNPEYSNFFKQDLDPIRIIKAIEATLSKKINPNETLIFFDEIQQCQNAINSLKYFQDSASEYHVIAAGSYLGLASVGNFPVGKTDSMTLYPMSFYEFLQAMELTQLLETILNLDYEVLNVLSVKLIELLRIYFCIGGMPEAVSIYLKHKDLVKVRKKQLELLTNYDFDFSNHIPANLLQKVKMIWHSIPSLLAKEKKKFVYKEIKIGGRASQFEDALSMLEETRLVYKVSKVTKPKIPLNSYLEKDIFKLYMLDVGLLCAKSNIDISTFYLNENDIFSDFQGALTEQYVLQELIQAQNNNVYYWGNKNGTAEVDFLLQHKNNIIPIEVKSTRNTQSKSLAAYIDLEKPPYAVRLSLKNYGENDKLFSVPLYMIASVWDIVESVK